MLSRRNRRTLWGLAVAALALGGAGMALDDRYEAHDLRKRAEAITGGDSTRGRALFSAYGCGSCHALQGVPQAHGLVGPPLDGIATRAVIAGKLGNRPANLEQWLIDPQAVTPGTAMPRLGVSRADARDLAAFLYTRT